MPKEVDIVYRYISFLTKPKEKDTDRCKRKKNDFDYETIKKCFNRWRPFWILPTKYSFVTLQRAINELLTAW